MFNYIKNMWFGKMKLYIIFWVYYIIIGTLIDLFTIEKYNSLTDMPSFMAFLIFIIFSLFINKALWSSATNFQGKFIWKLLVKIIVVLDLIWLFILLPLRLFVPENFKQLLIFLGV